VVEVAGLDLVLGLSTWSAGLSDRLDIVKVVDYVQNQWAISQPGTAAAFYSDSAIDNVFGLFASAIPGEPGLMFYPHADGAPDSEITVHSDFRVMEDYICKRIGDYRQHFCGNLPPNDDPDVKD